MKKLIAVLLILAAVVSAALAIVYFTHSAASLPHWFPGYTAGLARKHTKHGIVLAGLAIVLLLAAWMASGNKAATTAKTSDNESPQF